MPNTQCNISLMWWPDRESWDSKKIMSAQIATGDQADNQNEKGRGDDVARDAVKLELQWNYCSVAPRETVPAESTLAAFGAVVARAVVARW